LTEFFERLSSNSSDCNIDNVFDINSLGDFTKNQFCQDTIISFDALISKATTGTQSDSDSIIVIPNESIVELKRKTLDFSKFSIIDFLSNNHKNFISVSDLNLF
jgi:hypothetical protein